MFKKRQLSDPDYQKKLDDHVSPVPWVRQLLAKDGRDSIRPSVGRRSGWSVHRRRTWPASSRILPPGQVSAIQLKINQPENNTYWLCKGKYHF